MIHRFLALLTERIVSCAIYETEQYGKGPAWGEGGMMTSV